jgi:hypothetical protein
MPIRNEQEAYKQALNLVTALYQVNKNDLPESTLNWLESESEIRVTADDELSVLPQGKLYEGIFKASQKPIDIGPDRLWMKAQKKLEETLDDRGAGDELPPVPIIHRRLLRLYWMVHFAAQDLIKFNPRVRLGKMLVDVEQHLREAFVESQEGIKLPLAMLRKRQWDLLAKYGMGLTVDAIYDLHPGRRVIQFSPDRNLYVGILIGIVIGFAVALLFLSS